MNNDEFKKNILKEKALLNNVIKNIQERNAKEKSENDKKSL